MTQYTFSHSPSAAGEIVDQVNALLRHSHLELLPAQQAMLAALRGKWHIHGVASAAGKHGSHSPPLIELISRDRHRS